MLPPSVTESKPVRPDAVQIPMVDWLRFERIVSAPIITAPFPADPEELMWR